MLFRHLGRGSVHHLNLGLAMLYGMAILIGFRAPETWAYSLPAALFLAGLAWFGNLRRYRLIADHPTSRIASAPQGYVELSGRGSAAAGFGLVAPLSGMPCVWFRFVLERRQGDKWVTDDSGESTDMIQLDDGTGRCLLDPEGAEVHAGRYRLWGDGSTRKKEWLIEPDAPLYAIGEHRTLGGADTELDVRSDLARVLNAWKTDQAELRERFDRNGDGQIDAAEWREAQRLARSQVEAEHLEIRNRDGVHRMGPPQDGRPYLIASLPPAKLASRYRGWSWFHLIGLMAMAFTWLNL